jgi:DNA repair protein RecO (recombination protein O)
MPLCKSAAIVLSRFALAESDLVVSFFTREHGLVRGVARGARRMKSRFPGALELFTAGDLIFFDGGRSDLVQVDHFDITRPFGRVREDLERLGHAAWIAECVARMTAERDPHPVVYGLLGRALDAIDRGTPPGPTALAFGARCVDALGHRLRLDACVACRRPLLQPAAPLALDIPGGGVLCRGCGTTGPWITPAAVAALKRLRVSAWDEATRAAQGAVEADVREVLEAHVAYLVGRPSRVARFLREVVRETPARPVHSAPPA